MVQAEVLSNTLTARRREILSETQVFHDLNGYAPTVRDLCSVLGVAAPSTIHNHLLILREGGLVDWVDGDARTLHLTAMGRHKLAESRPDMRTSVL